MRSTTWPAVLLAATPLVPFAATMSACQQEGAAPPDVSSASKGVDNGGPPDSGFGDDSAVTSGAGVTTLASGLFSPRAIALGASTVYWTTGQVASAGAPVGDAASGTGGIESVGRTGGSRSEVLAGLTSPRELVVFDTTIYFAAGDVGVGVLDAFIPGARAVSPVATGQSPPLPMLLANGSLYWAGGTGKALDVFAASTSDGHPSTLSSDAEDLSPVAIAAVGTSLYVLANGAAGASILELPAAGGSPKSIWHDAAVTPSDLAAAGTTLYWIINGTADGGEVLAMPTSGGTPIVLASSLANPARLAVMGTEVYFTSNVASGAVLEVGTGGGGITTLASGLDYPLAVAVDDAVYFTTATTVSRVPR